jgi:hypothetical protein
MTKPQSSLDVVIEMLRDLEEFERSGSKEAFRKQLREEFVCRSGAASLDEALPTAMTSLVHLLRQTLRTSGLSCHTRRTSAAGDMPSPQHRSHPGRLSGRTGLRTARSNAGSAGR